MEKGTGAPEPPEAAPRPPRERPGRAWRGSVWSAALLLAATSLVAQGRGWGREGRYAEPLRQGIPERSAGFMFCRLQYSSVLRFPSGYGWSTDYPRSDRNFMTRLQQITFTQIARWDDGDLGHAVVRATDPELFRCPFLFASDIGSAGLSDAEVEKLRAYLLKGGFLWVDDFWGEPALRHWIGEIGRVLPEHAIEELTPEHPLYSTFYALPRVPQIPSIQSWQDTGGATQERGFAPGDPRLWAVVDHRGRILVLMTHNTDIADGWEREEDNEDFFYAFTAQAYGVGINAAVWAMSR